MQIYLLRKENNELTNDHLYLFSDNNTVNIKNNYAKFNT